MSLSFDSWVRSLAALPSQVASLLPAHVAAVRAVIERLNTASVTVTFGGRFKSGKSSLLNAVLRRALLPTKDLPETGANCHLTGGPRDEAALVRGNTRHPIPCSTSALQQAISLRGGQAGMQRLSEVDWVDIRLADFPAGPNVRWIDPPGMFDRDEMTVRAVAAAEAADVLVWVFNSMQFLGEAEVEALAGHIAQRGPGAVLFVENAFLPTDVGDPWGYHRSEIAPVNQAKLHSLAGDMGLPAGKNVPILIVSAAKGLAQSNGFGMIELRGLLQQLARADGPRIRRSRLQWAKIVFEKAAAEAKALWDAARSANQVVQRKAEQQKRQLAQQREQFEREVAEAVNTFLILFESTATACAARLASEITADNLARDDGYSKSINAQLQYLAEAVGTDLIAAVQQSAAQHGCPGLSRRSQEALKRCLTPDEATVEVPNNSIGGENVAAGALAGAAAGAWFFGVGAVVGAALGAAASGLASAARSTAIDVEQTKARIEAAASSAASLLQDKRSRAIRLILEACTLPPTVLPEVSAADREREQRLARLSNELEAAAKAASQLAGCEVQH